jgi:aryl-alcohol dehydrogenase-like predicted oxidoreductase
VELRRLGRSGLAVSAIGLGCNNLGRPGTATESVTGAQAVVDAALDVGVNLFDVADVYGAPRGRSEELLGKALAGKRDRAVIATKFGMDMQGGNGPDFGARGARGYVRRAVEASLRRLGTEWIDLYQLHRPDPATPIEETLDALDALVAEGKIRYVGHCNLAAWQVADAAWARRSPPRTTTRCWNARPSARSRRPARTTGSACCPTSRWPTACSPVSTRPTRRHRRAAASPAATTCWPTRRGTGSTSCARSARAGS